MGFTHIVAAYVKKYHLVFLVGLILLGAVLLRFPGLSNTPPWYTDEGFYLQMSWNVIHGHLETFGVGQWSFVSPLFTTPPLYEALLGVLLAVFGKAFIIARVVTACFGIATVFSLWWIGSRFVSKYVALLPAFAYAVIPIIVVNNRWGFPQTIAGLCLLWALYFLLRFVRGAEKKYVWWSMVLFALASCMTYWVIPFVLVYVVGLWGKMRWKSLVVAAGALFPLILLLAVRAATIPGIFFGDIGSLLHGGFVDVGDASHSSRGAMIGSWFFQGVVGYITRDILLALSTIGLFFIADRKIRKLCLTAFLSVALPLFVFRYYFEGFFYPGLLFVPLGLLGLLALDQKVTRRIPRLSMKIIAALIALYAGIIGVAGSVLLYSGDLLQDITPRAFIYSPDTDQMRETIAYVNAHTTQDDFVIAPHAIGAQLTSARYTTPVFVACATYRDHFSFIGDTQIERPLDLDHARYFVDDTYFAGDASVCYSFRGDVYERFQEQQWPVVFHTERFVVYHNPALP